MRFAVRSVWFQVEVELSWGWFTFTASRLIDVLYDGACVTHRAYATLIGLLHEDGTLELWPGTAVCASSLSRSS